MKEAVREITRVKQEVFMLLIHWLGETQVDFGYALVKVSRSEGGEEAHPPSIRDDGWGFNAAMRRNGSKALGLNSMKEMVAWSGGQVKIKSAPGRGTTIKTGWPKAGR